MVRPYQIRVLNAAKHSLKSVLDDLLGDVEDEDGANRTADLSRAYGQFDTVIQDMTDTLEKQTKKKKASATSPKLERTYYEGDDCMYVGNLRKLIEGLPDEAPIFPAWADPANVPDSVPSIEFCGIVLCDGTSPRDPRKGIMIQLDFDPLNEDDEEDEDNEDEDEEDEDDDDGESDPGDDGADPPGSSEPS